MLALFISFCDRLANLNVLCQLGSLPEDSGNCAAGKVKEKEIDMILPGYIEKHIMIYMYSMFLIHQLVVDINMAMSVKGMVMTDNGEVSMESEVAILSDPPSTSQHQMFVYSASIIIFCNGWLITDSLSYF